MQTPFPKINNFSVPDKVVINQLGSHVVTGVSKSAILYNAFPQADFIVADGYIDMANGFGVKSRYEFSFHVEKYTTANRFFFSCLQMVLLVMNQSNTVYPKI